MENTELFKSIDELLSKVDLSNVTSDGAGFTELPDGYYLSAVQKTVLTTSKSSGMPMISFTLKTVEDGKTVNIDEAGNAELVSLPKTKNRTIFMHYVLKDEQSIRRFVADMLKFEDEPGHSILPKEAFTTAEVLNESLTVLENLQVYVQISTSEKSDGTTSTWQNLVSFKRAIALGIEESK